MKFILIGKTSTGKHFMADKLAQQGLRIAASYTTNPDTPTGTGYPTVITPDMAANVPINEKFMLFSPEPNTETYILHKDLEEADVLILHPNDMPNLVGAVANESIYVLHMMCKDAQAQADIDAKNGPRPGKTLKERQIEETPYYSKWEQDLAAKSTFGMTQMIAHNLENDYREETIDGYVMRLMATLKCRRNLSDIIQDCIEMKVIQLDDNGNIPMQYSEPKEHTAGVPVDIFIDIMMLESPVQLANLITTWLSLSNDVTAGNRAYRETHPDMTTEIIEPSAATVAPEIAAEPAANMTAQDAQNTAAESAAENDACVAEDDTGDDDEDSVCSDINAAPDPTAVSAMNAAQPL